MTVYWVERKKCILIFFFCLLPWPNKSLVLRPSRVSQLFRQHEHLLKTSGGADNTPRHLPSGRCDFRRRSHASNSLPGLWPVCPFFKAHLAVGSPVSIFSEAGCAHVLVVASSLASPSPGVSISPPGLTRQPAPSLRLLSRLQTESVRCPETKLKAVSL